VPLGALLVGRGLVGEPPDGRGLARLVLAERVPAAKAWAEALIVLAEVLVEVPPLAASAPALVAKVEILVEVPALAVSPCALEVSPWQHAAALTRLSATLSHEPMRIAVVTRWPMAPQLAVLGWGKRQEGERARPLVLQAPARAQVRLAAMLVRPAPPASAAPARIPAPSTHQGRYV
jgi:hypothetical protein